MSISTLLCRVVGSLVSPLRDLLRRWRPGCALVLFATLAVPRPAWAVPGLVVNTTIDATNGGDNFTTLREALGYAQTLSGPHTITFAPEMEGQTFVLTLESDGTFGPSALVVSGQVAIDGGAGGVTITRSVVVNPVRMRHFYVRRGAELTLKSVTLTNGRMQGGGSTYGGCGAAFGGAIVNAGTLHLFGVTFSGNQVFGGSHIADDNGPGGGGGLTGDGSGSDGGGPNGGAAGHPLGGFGGGGSIGLENGQAVYGMGGFGGGGFAGANGGFGGGGGGEYTFAGDGGFGGGRGSLVILNLGGGGGGGGGFGGAIFNYGGTISGENVTFSGNSAAGGTGAPFADHGSGFGGAIFNLNGWVKLTNATIANNVAANGGGGIYSLGDNGVATQAGPVLTGTTALAPANVTLHNTILAGSQDGGGGLVSDFVQNTNDSGHGTGAGFVASGGTGNILQTRAAPANDFAGGALPVDPRLGPLANHGGPTPTHALLPGSPALNAAVSSRAASVDQRGFPRPSSSGLRGRYYRNVPAQGDGLVLLGDPASLDAFPVAATGFVPNIDFGAGTETFPGDGSVVDRAGSPGNFFGGIGVEVGTDAIGAVWEGALKITAPGQYLFTLRSDEAASLYIDNVPVIIDASAHAMRNLSGVASIGLTAGKHLIRVAHYDASGPGGVQLSWEKTDGGDAFPRQIIPPSAFSAPLDLPEAGLLPDIGAFEVVDTSPPANGAFAVLPSLAVRPGTVLTANFAHWTDVSPLTYEVREGATVIIPAGSGAAPTFTLLTKGAHMLTGRVTDAVGYSVDVGPVQVTVDDAAPVITVPDDIFVTASSPAQTVVSFKVTAADDQDLDPTVIVDPPSGSAFPPGTTTVNVTATDAAGNEARASFHVTVQYDFVAYTRWFTRDGLVPGAGAAGSGIEEEMLFASFSTPAINSAGDVAFLAKKHIGNVKYGDITFHCGARDVSSGLPTGKRLARVGDAVPGVPGVVWATLKDPLIADDGSVLVLGTVKSLPPAPPVLPATKTVLVWYPVVEGKNPQLVLQTGRPNPTGDGTRIKSILGTAIVRDGVVAFSGTLEPGTGTPPVNAATAHALFTWDAAAGQIVVRVRDGQPLLPGGPAVKSFKSLVAGPGAASMGRGWLTAEDLFAPADVAAAGEGGSTMLLGGGPHFAHHLRAQLTLADTTVADVSFELATGNLSLLFVNGPFGTELIGAPGVKLKSVGLVAAGDRDDLATIRATPASGAPGVFVREGNLAAPLARAGEAAPGTGGAVFKAFGDPVIAADGTGSAFLARFAATAGVNAQNDSAIFWSTGSASPPVLVAREGDPAPGTVGAVFKTFSSLAAPGGGAGPLVLAKLAIGPGGVTAANDQGLWARDAGGKLRLLLREGVTTIGSKTVKSFTTLAASAGTQGVTRHFNAAGEVVATVTFTDTTSAIITMTLPPPAPPAPL